MHLVAVLGIAHVYEHQDSKHDHHYPSAVDPEHLGKHCVAGKHGHDLASGLALPGASYKPGRNAYRYIVHHQGEQGLVGAPAGLEQRRDKGPYSAEDHAAHSHYQKQRKRCHVPVVHRKERRGYGAHGYLAFGAYVPVAHPEARSKSQSSAKERYGVPHHLAYARGLAQGRLEYRNVCLYGVGARHGEHQHAYQQRKDEGSEPYHPDLCLRHVLALGKADQRCFLMHLPYLPFLLPTSSEDLPGP